MIRFMRNCLIIAAFLFVAWLAFPTIAYYVVGIVGLGSNGPALSDELALGLSLRTWLIIMAVLAVIIVFEDFRVKWKAQRKKDREEGKGRGVW